jgi:AcrR family transcriptional regulator
MSGRREGAPGELDSGLSRQTRDNGIAREQVSEIQRARIVAAMVDVASERGAANATVARVVARSGVSRRTYYELFEDREDCFLAAFDEAVKRIAAVVVPAYEQPGRWRAKTRAALTALLGFLDHEPGMARLLIAEALGAGPKALKRRQHTLDQIISVADQGRAEATQGEGPPPLTAEGIVGGVLSLIHSRLLAGDGSLVELLNPLMAMIVLPYLGTAAARRELEQPVPAGHSGGRRVGMDLLRDLDMRLTYRTIRVLLAIGELSGRGSAGRRESHPSNRKVADAAGIRDQGQVSKLLARLQQLGLIENAGEGRAKGEPNKWTLTQHGNEVHKMLAP